LAGSVFYIAHAFLENGNTKEHYDTWEAFPMLDDKALFSLSYGLFVLSAREGERDNGCIINTAMLVTVKPQRLIITVDKANLTHDMVLATGAFCLSVLSEEADMELIRRFGFQSGRRADKFAGFEHYTRRGGDGLAYVTKGTNARISCRVVSTLDLGTHTLFLADIIEAQVLSAAPSATYAYYQAHIKPRPQPAPTAPPPGRHRWICKVCGYIYEGEFLPPDYICPLCKHPASDFELLE